MKTLNLEFQNEDTGELVVMTIGAADEELNTFYKAAVQVFVNPHVLAMQLGRLSEERVREIGMEVCACGVVLATEPEMAESEVLEWFKSHSKEFDILFEYADHKENFKEDGDGYPNEHGTTESPPEQGDSGAG